MHRSVILALVLAAGSMPVAPAPARAAGTFTPPPGCEVWLTVQARQCRVSNYYKCSADTPGDQWRADFDQEGVFFVSRIDFETQWVESYDMFPTVRQTLDPAPRDPANFSALVAEGIDTFAFNLTKDDGTQSRVRGFDRLTGQALVIDGVTLQETEFEYEETTPDGTLIRRARGREAIHPEWRLFFAGPSEWDFGDGYVPSNGSPVEFVFPGEDGFAATEPLFDCDAVMSQAPALSPAERLWRVAR